MGIEAYDAWLRSDFRAVNTALEDGAPAPDAAAALWEGIPLVAAIDGPGEDPYALLGMVGFLMAALRRHGLDEPRHPADGHRLAPVWALAIALGTRLGVTPRYVFAHQAFHAGAGDYRTFTTFPEERAFTELNGLSVLAYQRAAAALRQIAPLGAGHTLTAYLLGTAKGALEDVLRFNRTLAETVPVDRFFHSMRPYFKPHRVGDGHHRGTNAGDFSAVNEIDLHLGLVAHDDPVYAALLAEKRMHVPPEDQPRLLGAARIPSLLAAFLAAPVTPQLRRNAELLVAVRRAHGAAYGFHHTRLVQPFLVRPAASAPPEQAADMSASGPPLPEVVAALEHLRGLRLARGPGTAEAGFAALRARLG